MAWYAASAWRQRDVLTRQPSAIEPLDERERLRRYVVDSETGKLDSRRLWHAPSRSAAFTWQLQARAELADLRALLDHLVGRWRGIWVPSWHHDLVLAADIGINASTWTIKTAGFSTRYILDESRRSLILTQPNASPIYREVLAATDNGNGTETLDVRFDSGGTPNPTAISKDLATISFLRWMRLDEDAIAIMMHAVNYFTVQLPLVEVAHDVPSL